MENTNFHFTITSDHLHHALDMFASFFTCPLFTASGTDRELKAIDSEHSKNIQSDAFRFFQFLKDVSNPSYPFSNFATGNLTTLKEQPTQRGIDTRQQMIEHYKKHYSANLMKLVLYGKESNEVLRQWAEELFTSIPNHGFSAPTFSGKPFTEKELGHCYHVVPFRTKRSLALHFPLDVGHEEYLTKETRYFGHLVGHESEGSILYVLKARGWAESLTAGGSMQSQGWCLFTVSVEMTKEGLNHVEEIIDVIFQYFSMLAQSGVQETVYKEIKNLSEMEFRYLEPSQPDEFCCQVAHGMLFHTAEHGIAGDFLFFEYSPESIMKLFTKLHPANMNIYIQAHEFADKCDQTMSPWYGIKYCRQPIDPLKVARWSAMTPSEELHLPSQNPFIPENLDLKPLLPEAPDHPVVIHASTKPSMKVWFKQDNYYLKPKVDMYWALLSNTGYATARLRVLTRLFSMAVTERLNALSYHASVAQLEYQFSPSLEGLQITLSGFSDKVEVLLREALRRIKSVDVDEALFTVVRDRLKKTLENFLKEQAFHIAMDSSASCTIVPRWSFRDTLPIVDTVTLAELQEFVRSTVKQFHLQGYIQGNMLKDEALAIVAEIEKDFMADVLPMDSNQLPQIRSAKVPKGLEWLLPVRCTTEDSPNSAIYMMQQVGPPTPRTTALCDVFATATQSHFFTQLRTLETLGYIVQLFQMQHDSGAGGPFTISCIVQSSTHDPLYLHSRAYAFFDALEEYFEDYKEEDLKGVVEALIAKRREKPKTLADDAADQWREIKRQEFLWDRKEREVAELETLTKADLVQFFRRHFSNRSATRRRLTSLVYAAQHLPQYDAVCTSEVVRVVPTQLPTCQSGTASEEAPPEVTTLLGSLPSELAAVLQRLPLQALQAMVAEMPPEAAAELATASVADVEALVQGMLADSESEAAADDSVEAAAKSPLRGIERFNAAPPQVDLHYILDAGHWKQTLPTFPSRLPGW
eukprot:GGOE01014988.1.p1 GENE.GGOE01014988.1~~GGOE01014988.1.p1  ORF type:complete len:1079 (+),score=296.16 GGOE01014988.1:306-3239(+)